MSARSALPRGRRPGDRGHRAVVRDRFGNLHRCDSKFEAKRGAFLDRTGFRIQREGVVIPYVFNGRRRRYRPDWVVKSVSGQTLWIEEDKPTVRELDPVNQVKFAAARRYCARLRIPFRVITERNYNRP